MVMVYSHVPCVPAVSYLADGSGAGLNDLLQQNVDFAATDVPLYALRLHLPYAMVQNAAGQYVAPSIQGAQAAAASAGNIPASLRFFIVNAPGIDA